MESSKIMDVERVDALIGSLCDAVRASGCNLLEAHQALKSVDAVLRQQIRESVHYAGFDGDGNVVVEK
ncbi:hypothetical protein [Adlercreutzia caecimuris]|uniref:hypothetical protein n=1 Tax=Adlercreutzia caecimuris TaxID=671266 RepID=UPI00258B5E4A|nr:hypothetical protein [Adlercreutzia caecimuris]